MKNVAEQVFNLQIITPEQLIYEGPVSSVIFDTTDGQMGILKNRAPAYVLLKKDGRIRFRPAADASATRAADALAADQPHPSPSEWPQPDEGGFVNAGLSGGFAYINKECIVYADDAWWFETDETGGDGRMPADREGAPVPLQKLTPNTPPRD